MAAQYSARPAASLGGCLAGVDGILEQLGLPWEQIRNHHKWFNVISAPKLAWEFNCAESLPQEMTERQMRELVRQLGAEKVESLGQIFPDLLPEDLPPAPTSYLFSDRRSTRNFIGRQEEQEKLVGYR
jgi:hypothetical protein